MRVHVPRKIRFNPRRPGPWHNGRRPIPRPMPIPGYSSDPWPEEDFVVGTQGYLYRSGFDEELIAVIARAFHHAGFTFGGDPDRQWSLTLQLALKVFESWQSSIDDDRHLARVYARLDSEDIAEVSRARPSSQPQGKREPSQGLRMKVFERDSFRCLHCGIQKDLSVDHVVPWSRGGPTVIENLQTLCRKCNSRKRDKLPESRPESVVSPAAT
jgi:hypothetical protein